MCGIHPFPSPSAPKHRLRRPCATRYVRQMVSPCRMAAGCWFCLQLLGMRCSMRVDKQQSRSATFLFQIWRERGLEMQKDWLRHFDPHAINLFSNWESVSEAASVGRPCILASSVAKSVAFSPPRAFPTFRDRAWPPRTICTLGHWYAL